MLIHQVTYDALLVKRGVTMDEANRAATVIQAAFRGYHVRKHVKFVPGPPKDPVLEKLGIDKELAERASIKIQAAFRGYLVRKSFLGAASAYGDHLDKFGAIFNILNKSYLSEGAAEAAAARLKVALGSLDAVSGDATPSEASEEEMRAERVPDHIPVGKELLYVQPTEEDVIPKTDDKAEADEVDETEE
ncbi:uncharacterized protein [Anabrus simplex]|uniref:uncharacterized protein n=1 Tax=Anabrus simplex TaxID=316456 RepID=UPI0035A2AC1F